MTVTAEAQQADWLQSNRVARRLHRHDCSQAGSETEETTLAGIELITADTAPLLTRPYFVEGDPGSLVAALAQVPEVLEVALPFISTILGPSSITARRKEIVILRTSAVAGCRFCINAHSLVALDAGLTAAEVRALRAATGPGPVFADRSEVSLIAWVDLVAGLGPVDGAARQVLRRLLPDHQVMELTLLVGATLMLNRFCTALDLPTSVDVERRLAALDWREHR